MEKNRNTEGTFAPQLWAPLLDTLEDTRMELGNPTFPIIFLNIHGVQENPLSACFAVRSKLQKKSNQQNKNSPVPKTLNVNIEIKL